MREESMLTTTQHKFKRIHKTSMSLYVRPRFAVVIKTSGVSQYSTTTAEVCSPNTHEEAVGRLATLDHTMVANEPTTLVLRM